MPTPLFPSDIPAQMSSLMFWRTTPAESDTPSFSEADALADLEARLAAAPHVEAQLRAGGETGLAPPGSGLGTQTLRRWLVAEKWDVESAFGRLVTHAAWRADYVRLMGDGGRGETVTRRGAVRRALPQLQHSLSVSLSLHPFHPSARAASLGRCVGALHRPDVDRKKRGGQWGRAAAREDPLNWAPRSVPASARPPSPTSIHPRDFSPPRPVSRPPSLL